MTDTYLIDTYGAGRGVGQRWYMANNLWQYQQGSVRCSYNGDWSSDMEFRVRDKTSGNEDLDDFSNTPVLMDLQGGSNWMGVYTDVVDFSNGPKHMKVQDGAEASLHWGWANDAKSNCMMQLNTDKSPRRLEIFHDVFCAPSTSSSDPLLHIRSDQDTCQIRVNDAAPTVQNNKSMIPYVIEVNDELVFRVQYSDGTVKTGKVALV